MDCFYAAVHQRDDPSLRGKPVVIGGDPAGRGVVAAASYEVRRFGVRSAMPASQARRLCPQAIFIKPDFARYSQESEAIFALFHEYTPLVQTIALDEAYLDVSEHLGVFPTATALAKDIRRRVREERRLTVSIGVGPNRLVAKIASDFGKPDGLTVVPPAKVLDFLAPLAVRHLHGVGPATERALTELGIATIADLRQHTVEELAGRFGRHGEVLYRHARGEDERAVDAHRERKSVGKEHTYAKDLEEIAAMQAEIERLSGLVAASLARRGFQGRTVAIKVRYGDFMTITRARSLPWPVAEGAEIARHAVALLAATEAGRRPVRLLGVSVSNLVTGTTAEEGQLPLFR